mmetsp:Transcript_132262/g.197046  ORF Transcript_132262/g.197046 Transcript_132262/m.197046 type:complete len:81 (+) Transcript_132262:132-374(+)
MLKWVTHTTMIHLLYTQMPTRLPTKLNHTQHTINRNNTNNLPIPIILLTHLILSKETKETILLLHLNQVMSLKLQIKALK